MKVALISPLPPEKPGESIYSARLIEALAHHTSIEVLAISGPASRPLNIQVGQVETASIWRGRSLLYPFTLWRFIKKRKVNLVHVQYGFHGEVYGGKFGEPMLILLLLLKYTGLKTTLTLHSTWLTDLARKRIEETPKISAISVLAPAIFNIYMKLLDWGTTTIQLSTAKLGSTLKQRFLKEFGYKPDKVLEIPHPCAQVIRGLSKEDAKKIIGVTNRRIILVFGFIRRDKGIHLAINAIRAICKTYPDVLLLVVGKPFDQDGEEYLKELLELQREYDLSENVKFVAQYIPEDKIPIYFTAASIILAPYKESVGASGPLHAACGYGVPIVASDVGLHIRESLGGNVITFHQENSKSLREKLDYVLTHEDVAQELSKNLIEYAESESYSVAAERTIEYYRKTLRINKRGK